MCATTTDSLTRLVHEREFIKFLTRKIGNFGGSIKLQHITGHLSQVDPEVRETVGTSKSDISSFVGKHRDIFDVEDGVVTLINYSKKYRNDDDYSISEDSSLPKQISGIGVIVKLFPAYGFIKVKEPIKTSVFFSARNFLNCKHDQVDLTDFGLNIGTMVNFHAMKEKVNNFTSKYRATKVWKNDKVDEENNIVHKPRKNRDTGLYDPVNLDGEGTIQNVFPSLGFIAVNGDENNTVFFHKNRVVNYDNIVDLSKVFKIGDWVEFSAHRSTKQGTKARWEASRVWNKSGKSVGVKKQEKGTESKKSATSIISSNQTPSGSCSTHVTKDIKHKNSAREMIYDQCGKICPRSNNAVIKFGKNFTQLADGDASVYYICGTQVHEISWEFSDGDEVKFDAVKIKSAPGWKAILVWVGEKPNIVLPTCLGDFSAFSDEEVDDIPEDTNSLMSGNCLTASSRSSQKSVSMKSEFNDLESIGSSKEISNFRDSPIPTVVSSTKKDSAYGSQSNLSSFSESKLSSNSKNKLESEMSRRNGRSNPAFKSGRNFRQISQSKEDRQITSFEEHNYLTDTKDDERNSISEYSSFSVDVNGDKTTDLSDHEFTDSSEESDTVKNVAISECKDAESKKTACIRNFQGIVGVVTKVYSTFAEVESAELPVPVAFFWSVFYCERKSMEELELKDLREVLKVEDAVHFNYFEIVDDSGQTWNKVSLVWCGPKPLRVDVMTPKDFIEQNDLSVTVKSELNGVQPLKQKRTVKKFLTAFDDVRPEDKVDECMSQTESCPNDDCDKTFPSPTPSETSEAPEKPLVDRVTVFSDLISQKILMNKDLFRGYKVDLDSLSSDIVNLILERFKLKESSDDVFHSTSSSKDVSHVKDISDATCSTCGHKVSEKASLTENVKSTEVQTIFTGEVMAQNIFTQC